MRLLVLEAGEIGHDAAARLLVGATLAEVEREVILETLASCAGHRTRAAAMLGIGLRTLRNKIRDYGRRHAEDPRVRELILRRAGGDACDHGR